MDENKSIEDNKKQIYLLMASLVFAIGGCLFLYVSVDREFARDPAAISKNIINEKPQKILSSLEAKELAKDIEIIEKDEKVGLELGSLWFQTDKAKAPSTLCQKYDQLILEFTAEGVAVSGEKPKMFVQMNCDEIENYSQAIVWIPTKEIQKRIPSSETMEFNQESNIRVRFTNVFIKWPKSWILSEIVFFDDKEKLRLHSADFKKRYQMNW